MNPGRLRIVEGGRPVHHRPTTHREVHCIHIVRSFALRPSALRCDELNTDRPCQPG
jgi:hypothetical protein